MEKRIRNLLILGIIGFLASALYFTFVFENKCSNYECFQENMALCKRISFVSERDSATWEYTVLGSRAGRCDVKAKLLQPKKGSLTLQDLEGEEMICSYPLGYTTYPGTDLNFCTGKLKEEIQEILIDRLHAHVLENLGKLEKELESV
jgi:hypothetical protein